MRFLEHRERSSPVKKWDSKTNTLSIETTEPLNSHLHKISVAINAGKINVIAVDRETSTVTSRLIITADSEETARQLGTKKDFRIKNRRHTLEIDGSNEQTFTTDTAGKPIILQKGTVRRGENHTLIRFNAGDIIRTNNETPHEMASDGLILHGGTVAQFTINEESLEGDASRLVPLPTMQREIDIFVSKTTGEISYGLSTYIGDTSVQGVKGEGEVTSHLSGDTYINNTTGKMTINNMQGETSVEDFGGELKINGGVGNVTVNRFKGTSEIITDKGNITMEAAVFKDINNVASTTGDINITTTNDSLIADVVTHGELNFSDKFVISYKNNPHDNIIIRDAVKHKDSTIQEKKQVKGHLNNSSIQDPKLKVFSRMGNIKVEIGDSY